ncbi:MAG TPA: exopolysaccharide biosynthesis protein [Burkholderiales bacterium]|nr:exopolysaccharide biosynthesis protein [Burkholderiales bacterium]
MGRRHKVTNLEQLLDRITEAVHGHERVSLGGILEVVGRRSFGPLLLFAGLIALSPIIGDTPGVPTSVGIFVLLITGQLFFGREYVWLPRWLLRRSVARDKLCKALEWLRKPARFVDRLLRPRLTALTHTIGMHVIAAVCVVIAAAMPVMEVVPFVANGAGAALTAFGLALVAHDGLLAILAFCFTALTLGFAVHGIL